MGISSMGLQIVLYILLAVNVLIPLFLYVKHLKRLALDVILFFMFCVKVEVQFVVQVEGILICFHEWLRKCGFTRAKPLMMK